MLEFYVKGEDIAKNEEKFGGALVRISGEKKNLAFSSERRWHGDIGKFDWKKATHTFNSSYLESEEVMVWLTLANASGKVWFDEVKLTRKKGISSIPFEVTLFPFKFIGDEPFEIAENLVGTVILELKIHFFEI